MFRHERQHGARVDSAGQERADRNVADHLHANRLFDLLAHTLRPIGRARRRIDLGRRLPVALHRHTISRHSQHGSNRQLVDTAKDRQGRRHVAELEVGSQRGGVNRSCDAREFKQGLGLRRKCDPLAIVEPVDRLDAEPVTPHQQGLARAVPDGEPEHAVQAFDKTLAPLRVAVQHNLAVGLGVKVVTVRLQFAAQLAKVVDLAVADDDEGVVVVGEWLVPAGQVDDRQAAHPDRTTSVGVLSAVVGTAVGGDVAHPCEPLARSRRAVELVEAVNAAHDWLLCRLGLSECLFDSRGSWRRGRRGLPCPAQESLEHQQ